MYELYESLIRSLCNINKARCIFEIYPHSDPYNFFNTIYLENYTTFKRNPSVLNKGKLQMLWTVMVEMVGRYKANEIKNKAITAYNQNKDK